MFIVKKKPKGMRGFLITISNSLKSINWISRVCGVCPHCGKWFRYPKKRRINTAFVDDTKNFSYECKKCHDRTIEYYDEMWKDYYSGRY